MANLTIKDISFESLEEVAYEDDPYTMTEERLAKRNNRRYHGRLTTQLYACFVACTGSLIFGIAIGWSSPAFKIRENVLEEERRFSWIASMVPMGTSIGVPVWNYINLKVGPRKSLLIQSVFSAIVWVVLGLPTTNPSLHMACRFFIGFFSISCIICGETLLVDSVELGFMRDFLVLFKSFPFAGVILIYMAGQWIQETEFSYVGSGFVIIHSILLFLIPESPVFLFSSNERKAIASLKWYRGKVNANVALQALKRNADFRKLNTYSYSYILYSKVVVKGILIVVGLTIFQVLTGYYAFIFFNSLIWNKYGGTLFTRAVDTFIFGLCLFVARAISIRVHYSVPFGVRKPLILSATFVSISLGIMVVYCMMWEFEVEIVKKAKWFPLVAVCVYVISFELGLGIIPEILMYDYMPCQVYATALTLLLCAHWFLVFLLTKTFAMIAFKLQKISYFFIGNLAFAVIGLLYIIIFVVETKNKPLVQIQLAIGGNPIGNRSMNRKQRKSRQVV